MLISDFDYELPDALIARYPAADRRGSRLLHVGNTSPHATGGAGGDSRDSGLADRSFGEFPSLLRRGDLLVFNDTRVIKARVYATKETGGRVEILVERIETESRALVHIKASKSPRAGGRLLLADDAVATVSGRQNGLYSLDFSTPILPFLDRHGSVPLPPYLGRDADAADVQRYQTVYAKDPGAVAAPTAGLHFDDAMLAETEAMGVNHAWVTLHVGAGTFQTLREENIRDNRLHRERVVVNPSCVDAVRATRDSGGRVIAIGTTSVRALECASQGGKLQIFDGETDLFIVPGYTFRSVDAVLTNFHLPQSSLLMLVAAFAGRSRVLDAYRHAVREKYRFFSYGDAMFLSPDTRS